MIAMPPWAILSGVPKEQATMQRLRDNRPGVTQADLADRSGYSIPTIAAAENTKRPWTTRGPTLRAILIALGEFAPFTLYELRDIRTNLDFDPRDLPASVRDAADEDTAEDISTAFALLQAELGPELTLQLLKTNLAIAQANRERVRR